MTFIPSVKPSEVRPGDKVFNARTRAWFTVAKVSVSLAYPDLVTLRSKSGKILDLWNDQDRVTLKRED